MHFSQFIILANELGLSQTTLASQVSISRGRLNWARRRGAFIGESSDLLAGVQVMLDTIKTASLSSDAANFNHGRWLSSWIAEPNPALGGVKPQDLLSTPDGQNAVINLLSAMLHGVYQ